MDFVFTPNSLACRQLRSGGGRSCHHALHGASFLLPAAVLMFVYAWDQLLRNRTSKDNRRPPSQRALLQRAIRYKPINHRPPTWIRRKHHLRHRIIALQWRQGGIGYTYYYAPQHTSYAISFMPSSFFNLTVLKWLSIIEMWLWWIYTSSSSSLSS